MKYCDYCKGHPSHQCMPSSSECACCYNNRMVIIGRPERRREDQCRNGQVRY